MSTDLLTQLAEYGRYHREIQQQVSSVELVDARLRQGPPRPNHPVRRAMAALAAAVVVTAVIAIPALLQGPDAGPVAPAETTKPLEVPSTTASTTASPEVAPPPDEDRPQVQILPDGTAVAIGQGRVLRSGDLGETWEQWYAPDHQAELLGVTTNGAVIVVTSPVGTSNAMGPDSTVNETPEIHRYDPATGEWSTHTLERPEMPASDPQGENVEECALFGLQSFVTASAIVVGHEIVILGDHRVVADGICDEDFQFLWASPDGTDWTLIPDVAIDGYLTGVVWFGDQYVGYGASRPSYVGAGSPEPRIWTSTDLGTWAERSLELSILPDGAIVQYWPEIVDGASGLSLTFPIERYRPGLDASLSGVEALRQWRLDAGLPESPTGDMSLEQSLELDGIDFPLDADELTLLNSFYDVREPRGTLTLTTADGSDWESVYTP